MVYDPQRDRPARPSGTREPSPVDSLLDASKVADARNAGHFDPSPSDPEPVADPSTWRDRLLHSLGFSTLLRAGGALLVLRLLWRWRRRRTR